MDVLMPQLYGGRRGAFALPVMTIYLVLNVKANLLNREVYGFQIEI